MGTIQVVSTRSGVAESVHDVSVAVVDAAGALVASAGDAKRFAFWRSAAKPFQALAAVKAGAFDAFGFGEDALALACASHSSEPVHRQLAASMLTTLGLDESALACGPHPPLGAAAEASPPVPGQVPTPLWNNCSGKHALMLALAKHLGAPTEGYELRGHPVQQAIEAEVCAFTGLAPEALRHGVDGCTVVVFGLPLFSMARAWASLGASRDAPVSRVRGALARHPHLVAGTGRLCTDVIAAGQGGVLVKVGAEGVYSGCLPRAGLGLSLKVHDGHGPAAQVALLHVLAQLGERAPALPAWPTRRRPELLNTRGVVVGHLEARGALQFA